MGHLLSLAEQSSNAAETLVKYRRPDQAYVEYLVAMEIVTRVIPRHKDAVVLHHDRGSMHRLNKDLSKVREKLSIWDYGHLLTAEVAIEYQERPIRQDQGDHRDGQPSPWNHAVIYGQGNPPQ